MPSGWSPGPGEAPPRPLRALCGLAILLGLLTIGGAIFDRSNPERHGIGCALVAALVAYFAWFGVTGD